MIKVCDAIMGSGKSQSAITYMNEHPERKFVYITPYLEEAARIRNGCPSLEFVEPSDKLAQFSFSKLEHTRHLLSVGDNITTTHAAFRSYTPDMVESISKHEYILIVDEAVDVFQEAKYDEGDVELLREGGYVELKNGVNVCTGKEYTGSRLRDMFEMLRCSNLINVDDDGRGVNFYYWAIPKDILESFSEVIVLTYLFESQEFKYFLDIFGFDYKYIGIRHENSDYRFVDEPEYVPAYVCDLRNKVRVFNNAKLNDVGRNQHALSVNWLRTHAAERTALKNHLYNFIHNYNRCTSNDVMWSTFSGSVNALKGKGFSKQNVVFNMKASNEYRHKTVLGYCVNIFVSPQKIRFFEKFGIDYDVDGYALSTMIQWIWRSAIRDGKEIDIYIPSRRMRELLVKWIDDVSLSANAN